MKKSILLLIALVLSMNLIAQNVSNLTPVADAFTRDGIHEFTNYGTDGKLIVKNVLGEPGNNRRSYLKFDLSEIQGEIVFANLKLTIRYIGQDSVINSIALISDDSWIEDSITWENGPLPLEGDSITSWLMMREERYTQIFFNIASAVQGEVDGDRILSLMIYSPEDQGGSGGIDYYSKENTDSVIYNPVLEIAWEPATSVPDVNVSKFTLYPNPAFDHIVLDRIPSNKRFNAHIYSITGKLMKQKEVDSKNTVIDISDLIPGLYFLNIQGYSSEVHKFIKQ